MEPITRSEMLMDGQYVEPITRKEKILAGDDLEPVTREEYFLKKYRHSGGDVDVVQLTATENKTYTAPEGKAYNPVVVNVPTPSPSLQSLTASHNGYFVPSSGYEGFSEVTVDVPLPNNAYLLESQKNDVVSIQHGAEFDMPKLIASIEPQQDLHGYDSPWVGGAGKNKLQISATSQSLNGVTFTVNSDGTINTSNTATGTFSYTLFSGSLTFAQDVIINGCPENGSLSSYALTINNGATTETGSGITIPANTEITSIAIRIANGTNMNGKVFKPMIRLASVTDATFEPYSNICPISGWTACNVARTGKNLFDKTATDTNKGFISGKWINQTGNTFSYGDWSVSEYIRVDGEKIAVSGMTVAEQVSSSRGGYCCYDKYKNVLGGGVYNALTQIITLPTNTEYIRISVWNENKDVCQLELSETATAYEPYSGNTYTINFVDGSSPLTVYKGEFDVLSGSLKVYPHYDSYNGETINGEWISDRDVYAEGTTPTIGAEVQVMSGSDYTTYQQVANNIKSLEGVNNIWADTGEVDVQIWTKEV